MIYDEKQVYDFILTDYIKGYFKKTLKLDLTKPNLVVKKHAQIVTTVETAVNV